MSRLIALGRALVPDRAIDRPHLPVMLVLVLLSVFATTGVAALSSPISASVYQYDLAGYVYDAGETVAIDRRSPAASTIDPTAEIGRDPAQMPEPAVEAVATALDLVTPSGTGVIDDVLGAACRTNSFVPGTEVLMADGATKPIEDVEIGDWVWAHDPETGEAGARRVVDTIVGDGEKQLVDIEVLGDTIIATGGHPFWVDDEGRWVEADDLEVGDRLLLTDGDTAPVTAIEDRSAIRRVHNLTVDGIHTYYVQAGGEQVLVHNCRTIVGPGGVELPGVPDGAQGVLSPTGKGMVYDLPTGTPGIDPRVTQLRIMDPLTTGPNQYPNGYAVYMNASGQTVNPLTGRTVSNADPFAHIPLPPS